MNVQKQQFNHLKSRHSLYSFHNMCTCYSNQRSQNTIDNVCDVELLPFKKETESKTLDTSRLETLHRACNLHTYIANYYIYVYVI